MKVIEHTYGRRGKRKHELLAVSHISRVSNNQPYYNVPTAPLEPLIPEYLRTRPPAIPAPIQSLIKADPDVKKNFVMPNPPFYKPLSKKRESNARWRFYTKQKLALRAPLPEDEVQHIQNMATGTERAARLPPEIKRKLQEEMNHRRQKTGRFVGWFTSMSSRFIRRRYQSLLGGYIPVLSQDVNGKWKVQNTQSQRKTKYPIMDKRHLEGYTLPNGNNVKGVDERGAIIKDLVDNS